MGIYPIKAAKAAMAIALLSSKCWKNTNWHSLDISRYHRRPQAWLGNSSVQG